MILFRERQIQEKYQKKASKWNYKAPPVQEEGPFVCIEKGISMGSKYKIKKTDLKHFFATAEMALKDNYHELYIRLGLVRGKNGNFKCINEHAHSHGADKNPSMSISNSTGQWHCFTCEVKGNLQSYWSEYLKGGSGGDSYTDFLIDSGNMAESSLMKFSDRREDPKFEENSRQLRKLYDSLQNEKIRSIGRPWLISGELTTIIKELSTIPMKNLDEWVDNLLNNEEAMRYLWETRRITPEVVKKYRLGWFQHISRDAKGNEYRRWKYIFPTINAEGDLTNVKCYDPTASDSSRKWMHPYKGFESGPVPINNFTEKKIMFLEGEPDLYCAIAFGFEGCVTLGSKSMNDVDKVFGSARAKQLFSNKEIIICLDADEKETGGGSSSKKLALSLYPYARQIKIINLNKSNINPNGLDPNLFKEVLKGNQETKQKRLEKDFTDFMVKNGFDERAKKIFEKLVDDTPVFTHNPSRIAKQTFKVTLQEARMSRYFSADRSKELELSATLVDYCPNAYMYPIRFSVTCGAISGMGFEGKCKSCVISKKELEGESSKGSVEFFIVSEKENDKINNPKYIEINDHNILGLIEITDNQKLQQQKRLAGINEMCKKVIITDLENSKLVHVRLGKDVNQLSEMQTLASPTEIEMDAYINSDDEMSSSKTYKLSGSQTTAWTGQQAVLFIRKATLMESSIESFEMNQEIHDLLCVFKPQEGESIKNNLEKRYDILGDLAGITGRRDLFFLNDLAFFSAIEIRNKMLPEVTRGWVEVLIAGDSRTGKTVINKFLHNYYDVGEVVGGSSGVSRAGLLGGLTFFRQRPQIRWGKIPLYDKSVLTIDEMGRITGKDLTDLTETRSEGIAKINMIIKGKAPARTRKIFLSNPRKIGNGEERDYAYGIQLIKEICMNEDGFLARFDVATVVYSKDVSVSLFKSKYESETTKFTKFQCRHLIMWAYSRTVDDIIFEEEEEFNTAVNIAQQELSSMFHSDTQLINQESRAKLVRLSVSLATMLYSTPKNNPNKILVKKEHLDYIKKFLIDLYCSKNMGMGEFSKMKYDCQNLGDMTFMNCICKYVDIRPLARESEFNDKGIQQIFFDYIQRVNRKELFIPDAKNDSRLTTGLFINDATSKLIGILTTRNCLVRASRGMYTKSDMFKQWLEERIGLGEKAPTSNLLEPMERQSNIAIFEKIKELSDARREVKKQGTG